MRHWSFAKGHGTGNDFIVLLDREAMMQVGEPEVRFLCDRHRGIGGDGLLRAMLARHVQDWDGDPHLWFMDYRNADGSVSEMCGNGIRVFARYLHEREDEPFPMKIQTRDGIKVLDRAGDHYTADMGSPEVLGDTEVTVHGTSFAARHVSMGNPHAVVLVDNL